MAVPLPFPAGATQGDNNVPPVGFVQAWTFVFKSIVSTTVQTISRRIELGATALALGYHAPVGVELRATINGRDYALPGTGSLVRIDGLLWDLTNSDLVVNAVNNTGALIDAFAFVVIAGGDPKSYLKFHRGEA